MKLASVLTAAMSATLVSANPTPTTFLDDAREPIVVEKCHEYPTDTSHYALCRVVVYHCAKVKGQGDDSHYELEPVCFKKMMAKSTGKEPNFSEAICDEGARFMALEPAVQPAEKCKAAANSLLSKVNVSHKPIVNNEWADKPVLEKFVTEFCDKAKTEAFLKKEHMDKGCTNMFRYLVNKARQFD